MPRGRSRRDDLHGAAGVGLVPSLEEFVGPELAELGRALLGDDDLVGGSRLALRQVSDAVESGTMGYVAIAATAI